jgi:hypothetical protein
MNKILTLLAISALLTEKTRKDNKVSRQYYTAEFQDPNNPFAPTIKRVIWQQHNVDGTLAIWKGGNPEQISKFVGKQVPAEIVSRQVPAYLVGENTATKYTTVVFAHETIESVFKSAGHDLSVENTAPVANAAPAMTEAA